MEVKDPYLPQIVGLLAAGFVGVYRRAQVACAEDCYCTHPSSSRIAKVGLWTTVVLVTNAAAFPHLASLLLEI